MDQRELKQKEVCTRLSLSTNVFSNFLNKKSMASQKRASYMSILTRWLDDPTLRIASAHTDEQPADGGGAVSGRAGDLGGDHGGGSCSGGGGGGGGGGRSGGRGKRRTEDVRARHEAEALSAAALLRAKRPRRAVTLADKVGAHSASRLAVASTAESVTDAHAPAASDARRSRTFTLGVPGSPRLDALLVLLQTLGSDERAALLVQPLRRELVAKATLPISAPSLGAIASRARCGGYASWIDVLREIEALAAAAAAAGGAADGDVVQAAGGGGLQARAGGLSGLLDGFRAALRDLHALSPCAVPLPRADRCAALTLPRDPHSTCEEMPSSHATALAVGAGAQFRLSGGPFARRVGSVVARVGGCSPLVHLMLDTGEVVPVPPSRLKEVRDGGGNGGGGGAGGGGGDGAGAGGGGGGGVRAPFRVETARALREVSPQLAELRALPSSLELAAAAALPKGSNAGGSRGGVQGGLRPLDEEATRAQLLWAAEHFPSFFPASRPCEVMVDGRTPATFLGLLADRPAADRPAADASLLVDHQGDLVTCKSCDAKAPAAEAPAAEVPAAEVPAVEVPAVEVPAAEAPAAEAPTVEAPPRMAVVAGFFCARPVVVRSERCEVAPLEVRALAPSGGGERGALVRGGRCLVLWADGERSEESLMRFGATEKELSPSETIGSHRAVPSRWARLLSPLSPSVREALEADAAAWGFGVGRTGLVPLWNEREADLLRRQLAAAEAPARPAVLAALALLLGRPLSQLRERSQQLALAELPWGSAERGSAERVSAERGSAEGARRLMADSCAALTAVSTDTFTDASTAASTAASAADASADTLAQLQASVSSCAWALSEALTASGLLTAPAPAWRVHALDSDAAIAQTSVAFREEIKAIEASAYDLEAEIEAEIEPAVEGTTKLATKPATRRHADSRRYVFLIDDMSYEQPGVPPRDGAFRLPISAINEVDDEPLPDVDYLHSCIGGESVELAGDTAFLSGCACVGGCCIENGCACCEEQVRATGSCIYDAHGRLTAVPGTALYECNSACACAVDCRNRVVQRGVRVRLQVYKTSHKGWAVRALEPVSAGTFVCEYLGEIITNDEAERRGLEYDREGFSTLFDLDAAGQEEQQYTIDATYRCGVARFLNHSCSPNLRQFSVWVDNLSLALPRIAFFACRDIEAYEELTFDYKYEGGDGKLPCHCGAPNCRKWLY